MGEISLPLVTVYCSTYNHEQYIAQTLDGFVAQKTTFPFEVIVHDDASTDSTGQIIDDYKSRYPDLFHVIHQEVNQYQQGIKIFPTFIRSRIRGKYLAHCEGDDYWNDPQKLQIQYDYLENHPECSACVHDSLIYNMKTNKFKAFSCIHKECDIDVETLLNARAFVYHTSSLMSRVKDLDGINELTQLVPGIGDYPRRVYYAVKGSVHYINRSMSVYRYLVPGSWSVRRVSDPSARINDCKNIIAMLAKADQISNYRFHSYIKGAILDEEFTLLTMLGDYRELLKKPYRDILFHKRTIAEIIRILVGCFSPNLVNKLIAFFQERN